MVIKGRAHTKTHWQTHDTLHYSLIKWFLNKYFRRWSTSTGTVNINVDKCIHLLIVFFSNPHSKPPSNPQACKRMKYVTQYVRYQYGTPNRRCLYILYNCYTCFFSQWRPLIFWNCSNSTCTGTVPWWYLLFIPMGVQQCKYERYRRK